MKNSEFKKLKVGYERGRRDRARLLTIKEAHKKYHETVDPILNQIKEIKE